MNWRNRSISFALVSIVLGSHIETLGAGPLLWVMLVLQFILYPHLLYFYTQRLPHPKQHDMEIGNMLLDGFCFGLWIAFLGFPLWISFMLYIGVCMNLMVFQSIKGWAKANASLLAGVAIMVWLYPVPWQPQTSGLTTLLTIATLTLYIMAFGHDGYRRGTALKRQRYQLKCQLEENQLLQKQLEQQAVCDPLTGLYNRRHLDTEMQACLLRCEAQSTTAAIMLIDIDFFKQINDKHGHAIGDKLLQSLAQQMLRSCRAADIACRYGGDEFLLLINDISPAKALQRAQQLCADFARHDSGVGVSTTLSCGLAIFPLHGRTQEVLIEQADRALYQVKLNGRNCAALCENELEIAKDAAK